jgi:prolyl-tRNA editing enzyme YbaK/EbsC (Cys-tRNA(Pro) deacylase)
LPPDVIGKSAVNVTTTEAAEAVQVVGDLAKTVVVVTGQPQYVVFIDMLMRAAALFIAWFIRPKERKPKA